MEFYNENDSILHHLTNTKELLCPSQYKMYYLVEPWKIGHGEPLGMHH